MKKSIKFIVLTLTIGIALAIIIDFCRFPECYITTWKYQLQQDIEAGDEDAIQYYDENYIQNGRVLFDE